MNRISIYTVPVIFILTLLFSSCTKDPITPIDEGGFDSARYDYTIDTFFQSVLDIGASDTNEIYVLTQNSLMISDGNQYITHQIMDPSFAPSFLGVVEKGLAYIGGGNRFPSNKSQTRLMKWDGSSLSEINLNNTDSTTEAISLIYPFSPTEIWMSGSRQDVMKYDGNKLEYFNLDSGYQIRPTFKVNGQVYCFGIKSFIDSTSTILIDYYKIYSYENSSWTIVFEDTTGTGKLFDVPGPYRNLINDNLIARLDNNLYQFNGSQFYTVYQTNQVKFGFDLCGSSLNNLMIMGTIDEINAEQGIFNWNGNKWSIEISSKELPINLLFQHNFISVGNQYYLMLKNLYDPYLLYKFKPK